LTDIVAENGAIYRTLQALFLKFSFFGEQVNLKGKKRKETNI